MLGQQTPLVLGFVTSDDPLHVTFAHSPQRYRSFLGHHYDDQFFAFVGNDRDSTMALRLLVGKTTAPLRFRTLALGAHHADTTAAGAPQFQLQLDDTGALAVGQTHVTSYRIVIMPTRFSQEAMARGRLSLEEFHAAFIQPHLTEPNFLVNYEALTSWWIAATTDRANFGAAAPADLSALQNNVSENGSYAARTQLLAWARQAAESVLSRAPSGAGPDPLTGTLFSTAITQLSDRLQDQAELSRTELTAQRAADREAPSFSDRFGSAAGEALIALLGVSAVDDLPEIFISLGANKKNLDTDRNVIEAALTARSRSNNSPADGLTAPTVTPSILTLFHEQRLTAATPVIGVGLSPFNIACLPWSPGLPSGRRKRCTAVCKQKTV